MVGDHVVHLASDPQPLLGDGPLGVGLALDEQLAGGLLQGALAFPLPAQHVAEQPSGADEDDVVDDREHDPQRKTGRSSTGTSDARSVITSTVISAPTMAPRTRSRPRWP
jgi:hypothetical protein